MASRGWLWVGVPIVFVLYAGCGISMGDLGYTCANPDPEHVDATGRPDPCHYRDDPARTGQRCSGECVPIPSLGYAGPALVWFGADEESAPDCPPQAPQFDYEGHEDLTFSPVQCGACMCKPSEGSCVLPTSMDASSTKCPGDAPGSKHFDFSSVPGWNGACSTTNAIPANAAVKSLTIGALSIEEERCEPIAPPSPGGPPPPHFRSKVGDATWGTYVRACLGEAYLGCSNPGERCTPAVPEGSGFAHCLYKRVDGDPSTETCPAGYTDRHLVYGDAIDQRGCSPCECDPPVGSLCTSTISIFKDGACSSSYLFSTQVTSASSGCTDNFMSGTPFGSKSASTPVYMPGTCAPKGGQPIGAIVPTEPSLFCCRP